jgi:hypothetical protein
VYSVVCRAHFIFFCWYIHPQINVFLLESSKSVAWPRRDLTIPVSFGSFSSGFWTPSDFPVFGFNSASVHLIANQMQIGRIEADRLREVDRTGPCACLSFPPGGGRKTPAC